MTFVSYAQNFEDVILWRALKQVERGTYVDIGAQHPVIDSVSLAFYERGWRGVHVEASPEYAAALREARPDETVIAAAVGSGGQTIEFFEFPGTGLGTGDAELARRHIENGRAMRRHEIPRLSLDEVLRPLAGGDIHWLKVDVEGMESPVLESWRLPINPWIVVVEATEVQSSRTNHSEWEAHLLSRGYRFVYFDGLNRFYLSKDHQALQSYFGPGPNLFDDFVLDGRASAPFCAGLNATISEIRSELDAVARELDETRAERDAVARELDETRAERDAVARELDETRAERDAVARELDETRAERDAAAEEQARRLAAQQSEVDGHLALVEAYRTSTSWRVTEPLRRVVRAAAYGRAGGKAWLRLAPGSRPHRLLVRAASRGEVVARSNPAFMAVARRVLARNSGLQAKARRLHGFVAANTHIPTAGERLVLEGVQREWTPFRASDPAYDQWIESFEVGDPVTVPADGPRISVLVAPNARSVQRIDATIESLKDQLYPNWELVVAPTTGNGTDGGLGVPPPYGDDRFLVLDPMPCPGDALREAVSKAGGEFLLLLEPGDVLPANALAAMAGRVVIGANIDILYADEDVLDEGRRRTPQFKPEWSPELLRSFDYFGRPTLLRRSAVLAAGSFAVDLEPSAACWDLHLRMTDDCFGRVSTPRVRRETRVLCHRHPLSSSGRAQRDAEVLCGDFRTVLEQHWKRRGIDAKASVQDDGTLRATWALTTVPPVSVIIPNKDRAHLLQECLQGLTEKTSYPDLEIIIVDNGSTDPATMALYEEYRTRGVRIVEFNEPFNYSRACNVGARSSGGKLLLFLNNDIEVVDPDWMNELVRWVTQPGVGVVGTKLVYPDGVLQHAGVVIGMHVCGLVFHRGDAATWGPLCSPDVMRNWLGIMGACQMVRRSVFERIGGFDETYRIANSDIKLSLHAWRAGLRTVMAPAAKLVHHEGASRGKSNPEQDIRKTIQDIRALGFSGHDPYFHPGLSAIPPVPTLRDAFSPSTADSLTFDARSLGVPEVSDAPDVYDDSSVGATAGRPRQEILWEPDGVDVPLDRLAISRIIIDTIRYRADVRERFGERLSAGSGGTFASWFKQEASERWGWPDFQRASFDSLMDERLSSAALLSLQIHVADTSHPCTALLPGNERTLVKMLFDFVANRRLAREAAWWLLLELDEAPQRGLVWSWLINAEWQQRHPAGIVGADRRAFAKFLQDEYGVPTSLCETATWPEILSPAEESRLTWLGSPDLQARHPNPTRDAEEAKALIDHVAARRSETGLPPRQHSKEAAKDLLRPGMNVLGHFTYPSGLRTSTLSLAAAAKAAGILTSARNVPVGVTRDDAVVGPYLGLELFDVSLVHVQPEPFFGTARERAGLAERGVRPYQIGFWYWEFDEIPPSWDTAAEACDELWTATEFIASGLRHRYEKPVRVLLPSLKLPEVASIPRFRFGLPEDSFVFLFTFHMTSVMERKNPIGLIRAFSEAFDPDDDAMLVIKTSFGSQHPDQLAQLLAASADARIKVIDEVYTENEMLALMEVADAYVSLHRSEGLGLTMAEAMLLGRPTIATRYSGNLDFMTDENSLLVDHELTVLDREIPPYGAGLRWADPSTAHAARLMRQLYENRAFARNLGERGKADLEDRLSVSRLAGELSTHLSEIPCRGNEMRTARTSLEVSASARK